MLWNVLFLGRATNSNWRLRKQRRTYKYYIIVWVRSCNVCESVSPQPAAGIVVVFVSFLYSAYLFHTVRKRMDTNVALLCKFGIHTRAHTHTRCTLAANTSKRPKMKRQTQTCVCVYIACCCCLLLRSRTHGHQYNDLCQLYISSSYSFFFFFIIIFLFASTGVSRL